MDDKRTETGQLVVNWREIFDLRLEPIRQEMTMTRRAIEKLSEGMISAQEWQRMNEQCALMKARLDTLENRVEDLEHYHSVGMWAFRVAVGVTTAVSTAGLIAWLVR